MAKRDAKGITVKKADNFSEWYTQVIQKGEIADHSIVSGCLIYKPRCIAIWEKVQQVVDTKLKTMGIKNVYFPLLIPESLLQKEAKHVKGFAPEVAWVTHAGSSKLSERLAIRPTSETIMYDSYSKWIRSHQDLPLRLNQWNSVLRWEFKHPTPFLRSREFLWNEGHTCFATKKEAEQEIKEIITMYDSVLKEYFALPSLIGKKSEKEKFAGAEYTVSMEQLMPNGKAIQGPDAHFDGQNFAKAFDIVFTNQKGKKEYVWQNTFAISTRMLGILFSIHGDNKGLIIPPKLAPEQVVIIPIYKTETRAKVLKVAQKIKNQLDKACVLTHLDNRENYSPGWKFNEWEVKGVPIRIEIGPNDLKKKQVTISRRDLDKKETLAITKVGQEIPTILEKIQDNLFKKAKKMLKNSTVIVTNLKEAEKQLQNKKILFVPWCNNSKCEEKFKTATGAKTLNSPSRQPKLKPNQKCFACQEKAKIWFFVGKSY